MNTWSILYFFFLLVTTGAYGLALGRKLHYIRFIFGYCILILCVSTVSNYLIYVTRTQNNLFLFHIYTPAEYVILSLLYWKLFTNTFIKRWIIISIPCFLLASVFLTVFVQGVENNNSNAVLIESTLLCTWSLLFLRETILLQQIESLLLYPMFWVSAGILVYFIGSLFIEGLLNYLIKHSIPLAKKLYLLEYISNTCSLSWRLLPSGATGFLAGHPFLPERMS